jgi:pimeloyl-ACP methyl ester carboxylesterase
MGWARRHCITLASLAAAGSAHAELALQSCRLAVPWLAAVSAECGELTVPEHPAAGARSIALFVARVPAIDATPQPDPLVIIAGGPGQAATDLYLTLRSAFEPIRRDRDIVLVDQRGTGKTAGLSCPLVTAASLELEAPESLPGLMQECLETLDGDPRFYTTSAAVEDLDRVRAALAIESWNLYGASYGTRVAQHYLRRYPAHTRALILDGVVPPGLALGPEIAVRAQRALDRILARCSTAPECAARFPGLDASLAALRARLDDGALPVDTADPLTGEPRRLEFTAADLNAVLRLMSYSAQTAALMPLLISQAQAGNLEPLAAQSQMLIRDLRSAISLAMHNSVVCTEDVPFFGQNAGAASAGTYLGASVVDALQATCAVWPQGVRDADLGQPLQSDTPVLMLSGELDPVTPPEYAQRAASALTRARHLIGPGQGHGLAATGCVPRLMREFLADLEPAGLDAACLENDRPNPFFLDFNGPSP